ncbi:uncharacterized protein LOC143300727 isoform X2 [Babylonia areolata]|uniref:uncharacterized protein LOC143300727 isoform X2 n=1 Tax=Babylonia areolata TaxID=304850 RepID=UPI003FD249E0
MLSHMEHKTEESAVEQDEGPVFEIRIYGFNIKGLSEYLKQMSQGFWQVRSSFSAVLGPWKTEINGLYSLAHLLATRKKMLNHAEWSQYIMCISDLQMSFQNTLAVLVPGTELRTDFLPSESAVYEFQTMPESESRGIDAAEGGTIVGRFLSVYGPSKTEFCLLRYPGPKTAFHDAFRRRATLPSGASTRLMVPVHVSNMK